MAEEQVVAKPEGDDEDEKIDRQWEDRQGSLDYVKKKLRSGWRNDPGVLNQYFQAVLANWKVYKGDRTPLQVIKLQSFYRQATIGDCEEDPPKAIKSTAGIKWTTWMGLQGMNKEMAKRRFITFISEINPLLIDVMPDEKPPLGFPLDRQGRQICAKCNTKVGCSRPLLDQYNTDLKEEIFENNDLHGPKAFRRWIKNAIENQRCLWGVHIAISRAETKPFQQWFDKDENQGYFGYDSSMVMMIVRDLVMHHYSIAYDLQEHLTRSNTLQFNEQAKKCLALKEIYQELIGDDFVYMVPCKSISQICNAKRISDGGKNHNHPYVILPPNQVDTNSLQEAIELRIQCQTLGLDPRTGVVSDVEERCGIYRKRIADHFEALIVSAAAKERNDARQMIHENEKSMVFAHSASMIKRQLWDNCHSNKVDRVLTLCKRGGLPDEESPRGVTPLITLVNNSASVEAVEELRSYKANFNYINKHGFSCLMLACRKKDTKMIHLLMKNGASAMQNGGRRGLGLTALHHCAIHGSEEETRIILEYVKDGSGDALRVVKLLDAQDDEGNSPLILAARKRNGIMCRVLTSLGANPNLRNKKSRSAQYEARNAGWTEIADWLEKKIGSGVAKMETFSDQQFEKSVRYGNVKGAEAVVEFQKKYFELTQKASLSSCCGPPSVARKLYAERGETGLRYQQDFIDNHMIYIQRKDFDNYEVTDESVYNCKEIQRIKEIMVTVLDYMRKGIVNPNVETACKPLPLTGLMCAVIMSDIRTIRLMIREGSNPNYPNKDGTTAVMLAAQLNNVDALIELLLQKGSIQQVDNEGYNSLAYATSLPTPTCMSRNLLNVLTDGDTGGVKRITTAELLKNAIAYGIDDIKEMAEENEVESEALHVEKQMNLLSLLEKFGLTNLHSEKQVHEQIETAEWRITHEAEAKRETDNFSETSSEARERTSLERLEDKRETERQIKMNDKEYGALRCPMCTLLVPCKHFTKAKSLSDFFKKKGMVNPATLTPAQRSQLNTRKSMLADRRHEVLVEAHLADRVTDRSIAFVNKYRPQQIRMRKAAAELAKVEAEIKRRQQRKEEAIQDGTYSEWIFDTNEHGSNTMQNWETGETWIEYEDDYDKKFYFNIETSETQWDPPNKESIERELRLENEAREAEKLEEESKNKKSNNNMSVITNISNDEINSNEELDTNEFSEPIVKGILKGISPGNVDSKNKKKMIRFNIPGDDLNPEDGKPNEESTNNESLAVVTQKAVEDEDGDNKKDEEDKKDKEDGEEGNDDEDKDDINVADKLSKLDDNDHIIDISGMNELKIDEPEGLTTGLAFVGSPDKFRPNPDKFALENPVLVDRRRVYLFTDDNFARNNQIEGTLMPVEINHKNPSYVKKGTRRSLKKEREDYTIPTMMISGWLYTSLSSIQVVPVDKFHLPVDIWGAVLDSVRLQLFNDWLPKMEMSTCLNVASWRSTVPRCSVCGVGYARMFNSVDIRKQYKVENESFPDHSLCIPCVVRKHLYLKSQLALPRAIRRTMKSWPFLDDKSKLNALTLFRPPSQGIPFNQTIKPVDMFDPNSSNNFADASGQLEDRPSSAHMGGTFEELRAKSPIVSEKLYEIDVLYGPDSTAASGAYQDIDVESISKHDESTMTSAFSHSSNTTASSVGKDENKNGPKELNLIPFLIAKGHYEEVERIIRGSLDSHKVDEGEGAGYLIQLLTMQAEMYRMMNVYPLALGCLMDCVDILAGLIGFDDVACVSAIGLVANCLRKMNNKDLATNYVSSICAKLEVHTKQEVKGAIAQRIQDTERFNLKEKSRGDILWVKKISKNIPQLDRYRRQFFVYGLGGLYHMLTSSGLF
jgi:ankyrin repeat protein/acyl-CoA-binding protein